MEYQGTLRITTYKKYIILTLLDRGPKVKPVGSGTLLSDFNESDVLISAEALDVLKDNVMRNLQEPEPTLEIIAKDKLWWVGQTGLIIPPGEIIHIHVMPYHTICENLVDSKLKEFIDKN
jgi:hypothetical protein